MRRSFSLLLARLDGWPRRAAALLCLLLAISSAATSHRPARSSAHHGLADDLEADQVASSVSTSAAVSLLVHRGDRVDLLAGASDDLSGTGTATADATTLATSARVLAVIRSTTTAVDSAALIVATDRLAARRLAAAGSRRIFAVVIHPP